MSERVPGESRGRYHPLLGTNVDVRVTAEAASRDEAVALASRAEDAAVAEMVRLQAIFSIHEPGSELSRWRRGDPVEASDELAEVLAAAERWWRLSGGAFHPAVGSLFERWGRAEREGVEPPAAELDALVAGLAELPFRADGDAIVRVGDCSGVNLYAIAKGFIVDRAVAVALDMAGVTDVLVNAGGDLRHVGPRPVRVSIEDPAAPGGPPLEVVELGDGALATSGDAHRGFSVGGRRHGHVLDPRTGWPVEGRPSTSVRASDAMTADVLATVAGVLTWDEAGPLLESLPDVAALVVLATGVHRTASW